jgi:UDP:flavonoid glycosyltransferase YjiC (YdhE family)
MGIAQKALAAGVPVCVVRFGRDQPEVAGHETCCGAGTRLLKERLRPDRLRVAVRGAIARRQGAQRVAARPGRAAQRMRSNRPAERWPGRGVSR